jgi:hypothetical protein
MCFEQCLLEIKRYTSEKTIVPARAAVKLEVTKRERFSGAMKSAAGDIATR